MLIKITLLITMLLYAFIVAQSFFYILAMSKASKKMKVASYIETRQLIDRQLRINLSLIYYSAVVASIALIAFCVVNPGGLLFICAIIALGALIVDAVLALKGNVPINRKIDTWTTTSYPGNWQQVRARWFTLYHIRQVFNIGGFIVLLIGIVFGL